MTKVRNSIFGLKEITTKDIIVKMNFFEKGKSTNKETSPTLTQETNGSNILSCPSDLAGSFGKSSILNSIQPVVLYSKSLINTMFYPVCFSFLCKKFI